MSILSVDFGSVNTRAVLIDIVDGTYQLVARAQTRTTDGFPVNDLTVGLDRVLRELGDTTGRTLTGPDGKVMTPERPDRSGVDIFTATASIGRPLRAVIVGLMPQFSVMSAIRAATGTYIQVTETIHLDDQRTEQERFNTIILNYPDLIIIAGGTEKGAKSAVMELVELVRLAVSLTDASRRPSVIFAGNTELESAILTAFEGITPVLIAQNVRPSLNEEALKAAQNQLAQAFDLYKEKRSTDFAAITAMSKNGVLPTAQSYNTVVTYLTQTRKHNVLALDIGSAASVLAAGIQGNVETAIRTELGLGHNALTLLKTVGLEAIRRWLPFQISDLELTNYAANKLLRPATIPTTLRETYLEHALLRAAIVALLNAARPTWKHPQTDKFELLIAAGAALTGVGNAGYTALLILDTLRPTGVTQLYSDPFGLIAALGSIAAVQPEAVVHLLETDNLEYLGTSFNLSGIPRLDKPALKVKITLENGDSVEQTVMGGHLFVYQLPIGQKAQVQVNNVARGGSLGGKRRIRQTVIGGRLIFDARGEPSALSLEQRFTQMPMWIAEATGDPVLPLDPRWLEVVDEDEDPFPMPLGNKPAKADHRRLFGRSRPTAPTTSTTPTAPAKAGRDELDDLRDATLS
ncbi:MAG: glutamate mutase L [Anaerolineae bacterium]|nr:glutamate mutase L [Anaerolineae bacterium]